MKRPIVFFKKVDSGTTTVLVSPAINYPFKITRVQITFRKGTLDTLKLRFLISRDASTSTANITGTSIFFPQDIEFFGDGETLQYPVNIRSEEKRGYIKVVAKNEDVNKHTVNVVFTIEELEEGG